MHDTMSVFHVVDSSSDDDSSVMEDDSRLSSVMLRPPVAGAGSHHSRGSADSHVSRSAQSQAGSGSKVSQGAGAGRGGTPPAGASRDVDATPPLSRPSGSHSASCSVSAVSNVVCQSKYTQCIVVKPLMHCMHQYDGLKVSLSTAGSHRETVL